MPWCCASASSRWSPPSASDNSRYRTSFSRRTVAPVKGRWDPHRSRERHRHPTDLNAEDRHSWRRPVDLGRCGATRLLLRLEENEANTLAVHRVQPIAGDESIGRPDPRQNPGRESSRGGWSLSRVNRQSDESCVHLYSLRASLSSSRVSYCDDGSRDSRTAFLFSTTHLAVRPPHDPGPSTIANTSASASSIRHPWGRFCRNLVAESAEGLVRLRILRNRPGGQCGSLALRSWNGLPHGLRRCRGVLNRPPT
jgi:hypothetical protein